MTRDIVVGLNEDGTCEVVEPRREKVISYLFPEIFVLEQVSLDPFEAERVDVRICFPSGLEVQWSGLCHTEPVRIREAIHRGTRVRATIRNISDDVVRARIVLRGDV